MSSGSCLTSELYDKIIKILSKSHETIPLRYVSKSKCCQRKQAENPKKIQEFKVGVFACGHGLFVCGHFWDQRISDST
jgi:hypothetical protein